MAKPRKVLNSAESAQTIAIGGVGLAFIGLMLGGGMLVPIGFTLALAAVALIAILHRSEIREAAATRRWPRELALPTGFLILIPIVGLAVMAKDWSGAPSTKPSITPPDSLRPATTQVTDAVLAAEGTIDKFNVEGQELASTYIILRSYNCDIVRVDAYSATGGVRAEQLWVSKYYPGFTMLAQALVEQKLETSPPISMNYDVITIKLRSGRTKEVLFDVTSFFMATDVQRDYTAYVRSHRREFCA
ncbi:MAG: hypothetical protein ABW360_17405 [Phenylobacterium sp.]